LPGDMSVQGSGTPEGTFEFSGAKLRETLAWLGIDASAVPKERLQQLKASGKLKSVPGGLQISEASFEIDGVKAKAGGTVAVGWRISAALQLDVDQLDLDAYMPQSLHVAIPPMAAALPPPTDTPYATFGLKAKVAKLLYLGESLNGVDGDVAVQGN